MANTETLRAVDVLKEIEKLDLPKEFLGTNLTAITLTSRKGSLDQVLEIERDGKRYAQKDQGMKYTGDKTLSEFMRENLCLYFLQKTGCVATLKGFCAWGRKLSSDGPRGAIWVPVFSLVTEIKGSSVDLFLRKADKASFTSEKRFLMMFQSVVAVFLIHSIGIQHRDIKSANFVLDEKGNVCLIDFGTCKDRQDANSDANSRAIFTMGYNAPEIDQNNKYGMPADIWSLGVVLYEIAYCDMNSTRCIEYIAPGDRMCFWRSRVNSEVAPPPHVSNENISQKNRENKITKELTQMLEQCWNEADKRPKSRELLENFVDGKYFFADMDQATRTRLKTYMMETKTKIDNDIKVLTNKMTDNWPSLPANWAEAINLRHRVNTTHDPLESVLCAWMYHNGYIFDRDDYCAFKILSDTDGAVVASYIKEILAERSDYVDGCYELSQGNVQTAMRKFTQGASKGCVNCVTQMALALQEDKSLSGDLFNIAIRRGDKKAMYCLGGIRMREGNRETAMYLLEQASNKGHAGAQHALASLS